MTQTKLVEKMQVAVYESNEELGIAAANDLAKIMSMEIAKRGQASVILATGNSQLSLMKAIRLRSDMAWDRISVFHMDEYIGISEQHPASFRRYLRVELVDFVHPYEFYGIEGDSSNIESEMRRYAALLDKYKPIACVLGIGENGHLAFNDPPADFNTTKLIELVTLTEPTRQQQVGEGHFAAVDLVPGQAITLTIPALLRPSHVLAVVPEARKARAVKDALEGSVTPNCPASILRTLSHVKLYLDCDSAALLTPADGGKGSLIA